MGAVIGLLSNANPALQGSMGGLPPDPDELAALLAEVDELVDELLDELMPPVPAPPMPAPTPPLPDVLTSVPPSPPTADDGPPDEQASGTEAERTRTENQGMYFFVSFIMSTRIPKMRGQWKQIKLVPTCGAFLIDRRATPSSVQSRATSQYRRDVSECLFLFLFDRRACTR